MKQHGNKIKKGIRVISVNSIPENMALLDLKGMLSKHLERVRPLIGKTICGPCAYGIRMRCKGYVNLEEVGESTDESAIVEGSTTPA